MVDPPVSYLPMRSMRSMRGSMRSMRGGYK